MHTAIHVCFLNIYIIIYMCVYNNIYIFDGWSKFLYPGTAILRESFANSMFIFRGTHVEQQLLL